MLDLDPHALAGIEAGLCKPLAGDAQPRNKRGWGTADNEPRGGAGKFGLWTGFERRAEVCPGNAALSSGSGDGESGNNSLLDPNAEKHVLYGDWPTSGGHLSGVRKPGKSEFPPVWSPQDITNAISDIAADPKTQWSMPSGNGYITGTGTVNGVDIKVVVDPSKGRIVTGYPTNLPRNPK